MQELNVYCVYFEVVVLFTKCTGRGDVPGTAPGEYGAAPLIFLDAFYLSA